MHFCQLCCKISTENLEKFRLETEEDCEKKPFFQRKCSSWRRWYGQLIAVLKIVPKHFESKVRTWFAQSLKTRRRMFLLERHILIENISLETKKFNFDETFENWHWGSGTIHPEVEKVFKKDTFFQHKISFVVFRWRKKCTFDKAAAQFLQWNRKIFAQIRTRLKKCQKNLKSTTFPRKDPLARRVQFCKPCLRKFSRKWSWISQNTKGQKKFAQFSQKE